MRTLFLCGAGNPEGVRLARRVARACGPWTRLVLLDDDERLWGREILGVAIAGDFERLADAAAGDAAVNLVARTTRGRAAAQARIDALGVPTASLLDPSVDLEGAVLAQGVTVYGGAHIGPEVALASGCVVFMGAIVGHESRVGAGAVIASNAVLNARVVVGEGVYVGTNATVLPEISIGAWATVGAGSVVVQDVKKGSTVLGVPAVSICARGAAPPAAQHATPAGPLTAVESRMLELWREVLGNAAVGADLRFFEAGGDSLGLIRLQATIATCFGTDIPLGELIRATTVHGMSAVVEEALLRGADESQVLEALAEINPPE